MAALTSRSTGQERWPCRWASGSLHSPQGLAKTPKPTPRPPRCSLSGSEVELATPMSGQGQGPWHRGQHGTESGSLSLACWGTHSGRGQRCWAGTSLCPQASRVPTGRSWTMPGGGGATVCSVSPGLRGSPGCRPLGPGKTRGHLARWGTLLSLTTGRGALLVSVKATSDPAPSASCANTGSRALE